MSWDAYVTSWQALPNVGHAAIVGKAGPSIWAKDAAFPANLQAADVLSTLANNPPGPGGHKLAGYVTSGAPNAGPASPGSFSVFSPTEEFKATRPQFIVAWTNQTFCIVVCAEPQKPASGIVSPSFRNIDHLLGSGY